MEQRTAHIPPVFGTWGFWGVLAGAIALIAVFFQIAGPALEPAPSIGTQLGEIAGEMKRSAWRSFLGMSQPEPEAVPTSMMDWVPLVAPVLGTIGIILALVSGIRGEDRRLAIYGTGLGVSAIVFHFVWMVALLIVGAMLLVAIISNLGEFFSF